MDSALQGAKAQRGTVTVTKDTMSAARWQQGNRASSRVGPCRAGGLRGPQDMASWIPGSHSWGVRWAPEKSKAWERSLESLAGWGGTSWAMKVLRRRVLGTTGWLELDLLTDAQTWPVSGHSGLGPPEAGSRPNLGALSPAQGGAKAAGGERKSSIFSGES